MTSDVAANKQAALAFCEELFKPGRAEEAVRRYLSPDYIQHNPNVADGPLPLARWAAGFLERFPDLRWDLQRAVAEDDLVVAHWHLTTGPDDRGSAVIEIFRFENGLVAEHWDVMQPVPETAANDHPLF